MSQPAFLREQQKKKEKNKDSNKGDFRQKCRNVLASIKDLDEDKYKALSNKFHAQFDKDNIAKKKIVGFYGEINQVLKVLREDKGLLSFEAKAPAKRIDPVSGLPLEEAQRRREEAAARAKEAPAKAAVKKVDPPKKEVKKEVKRPAAKAPAKKAPAAKKAAKKVAKKAAKKTAKKAAKKVAKKTAKKTAKKAAAKKAPAKKKAAAKKTKKKAKKK